MSSDPQRSVKRNNSSNRAYGERIGYLRAKRRYCVLYTCLNSGNLDNLVCFGKIACEAKNGSCNLNERMLGDCHALASFSSSF
jgi:hypothetical protein